MATFLRPTVWAARATTSATFLGPCLARSMHYRRGSPVRGKLLEPARKIRTRIGRGFANEDATRRQLHTDFEAAAEASRHVIWEISGDPVHCSRKQ